MANPAREPAWFVKTDTSEGQDVRGLIRVRRQTMSAFKHREQLSLNKGIEFNAAIQAGCLYSLTPLAGMSTMNLQRLS